MKFILENFIRRDNLPERTRIKLGGMKFTYLYTMRRHATSKDGNIHVFMCDLTKEKVDIYDEDLNEKIWKHKSGSVGSTLQFKVQFICPGNYHDAGQPEQPAESDKARIDDWFKKYYCRFRDDDEEET